MIEKLTKPIFGGNLFCQKKSILVFTFLFMMSQNVWAQSQKITLNMKNAKRTAILNEMKKQVEMEFFYNVKELNKYEPISIYVKDQPIVEVIKLILKGTNLKYSIENNVVNILLVGETTKTGEYLGLMLNVSGVITGENGKPLSGASIRDSKNEFSTTSNPKGEYSINLRRGSTLIFSYVGTEPFKTSINAVGVTQVKQNVQLNTSANVLDEVGISTGYQDIAKRDVVGSLANVKMEDIKVAGITSIDQLLQGQLAGVAVANVSGIVGTSPRVRVRGTSTLLGNQEPVWVVDGIIQQDKLPFDYSLINSTGGDGIRDLISSSVSFLNVEDIEDVTVLKDASATAIYGVKAANGVIVIRTKKGKSGKTLFNYNTSMSISAAPSYDDFNLMNSQQRIDVSKEIFARGLTFQFTPDNLSYEGYLTKLFNKEITQAEFNAYTAKLETNNADWFGLLYQNSFSQNHSISASGGSDKLTYYASVGYNNRKGSSIGNSADVYNLSLNLNANVSKRLKLGFRVGGNLGQTEGFYQFDPFKYAYNTSRAIPAYNEDGSWFKYKKSNDFSSFNILNERDNTGNKNKTYNFSPTFNLDYKIMNNLSFESIAGLTYSQTNGESYATAQSYYIGQNYRKNEYNSVLPGTPAYLASYLPSGGVLNGSQTTNLAYTFRNAFNFKQAFRGNKDYLNVLAGVELRSSKYDGQRQLDYGYLPDRGRTFAQLPSTYTPIGNTVPSQSPLLYSHIPVITDQRANFMSYFGTATYNMDHKYVLNATIRTDASNRFGQTTNNRFLPIWSAGFKWNVMEEGWFNNRFKWLNQFSLRASYGFQGNVAENFGPELILQYPTNSLNPNTGEGIMAIRNLGYPDLRWEKTTSSNIGLDFTLLSGRISGTADYYHKKTTDVLAEVNIPLEYGIATMPVNAGDVVNKGYEIYLNFVPLKSKDFLWSLNFNTAKNFNNVVKAGGILATDWRFAATGALYREGMPVSGFWAFDYKGLDPLTGYPTFNIPEQNDITRKDVTKLMVPVGQRDAKFNGGLGTNFRYKNFTFNSSFNVSLGAHKFLAPLYKDNYNSAAYPTQNLPSALINRWRKPGDEAFTQIPSLPTANMTRVIIGGTTNSAYELYDLSTARVVNADYLRCRNIALGYQLPAKSLTKLHVRAMRFQASVSNPFYIASEKLDGIDPEVDGNSLPIPRIYSLTLSVGI